MSTQGTISLITILLILIDKIMQLLQLIPNNDIVRINIKKLSVCTPFSCVTFTFLKAFQGPRLMVVALFSKKAGQSYSEWLASQALQWKLLMSSLWWERYDFDRGCFSSTAGVCFGSFLLCCQHSRFTYLYYIMFSIISASFLFVTKGCLNTFGVFLFLFFSKSERIFGIFQCLQSESFSKICSYIKILLVCMRQLIFSSLNYDLNCGQNHFSSLSALIHTYTSHYGSQC